MDPRWLRGSLATLHNICAPGTCHAYQNVAYDAASRDRRAGDRPALWRRCVRERLFAPLGMTRRQHRAAPALMALAELGAAACRRDIRGPVEVNDIYYRVPAAGGVNGSIKDLAIWMLAQMGARARRAAAARCSPRCRRRGCARRARTSAAASFASGPPVTAYGLGWRVFDYAGHRVIGHHGGVRGYRSMILFDPRARSRRRRAVELVEPGARTAIEYEVMDMVYRLPFRDWLELDKRRASRPTARAGATSGERSGEVEGGTA